MVSTCSLETLTTRCDIFRSIVPVLSNGDSADGDKDRFRLEGDLFKFDCPVSIAFKSSPSRDPLEAAGEEPTKRTLKPELRLKLDPRPLSWFCPLSAEAVSRLDEGFNLVESVKGKVSSSSSSSGGAGEKNAGPSSSCTDTMSSRSSLFVLKLGNEGLLT